ncbi:sulfatase-like hydrolase/transferase [Alsobacter sp. SYSU M60028]|uniref:Sulfatase-like hydrolase/transferase n=1 Tax=Alsobacter ponti TaxID=2962936 RepID=A0ABT1LC76_9HYPH|nr:sulfatase-like hydrolase/transferase [Alsobacter ponti]MCP8939107.1 sulfatase-like hydrolase/transferase [Alsobacter ponti]
MTRPNIVLVFSDQQRMDSIGAYGNRFVETPNLDAMAEGGMRFTHAFTPWPVCTPARGTMWTGAYPHAHGLIDNVYGVANAFDSPASLLRETVFDRMKAAGYLTAHFGKWHLGEEQPRFFDVWEECFNSRFGHWIDGKRDGVYRPDRQTDACVAFLRRQATSEQPFVMVQSYYPPHDPYTAPSRYYEPYRGRGVPFAGYYAAVTALDACLGRIRDTLRDTGLDRSTLVIYYSDHGDTFWYRREGEHKFVCHDDAIRIPFIAEGPGVPPGSVCDLPVGLQDLAPTLIELAGGRALSPMHGASLVPLLRGERPAWRDDYYVENITHISKIEQRCVRTADWKLIASGTGQHELYNLRDDPEEELDLFLTPRPDGEFRRFDHFPDFAREIDGLADRMVRHAEAMGDDWGAQLGRRVKAEIAPRLAALAGGG